jgi:hypothetical protein
LLAGRAGQSAETAAPRLGLHGAHPLSHPLRSRSDAIATPPALYAREGQLDRKRLVVGVATKDRLDARSGQAARIFCAQARFQFP